MRFNLYLCKKMQKLSVNESALIKENIQAYFNKNENARFIHRLHGILLLIDNKENTCDFVGSLFGNSPRTISNWVKKVNSTGDINSLREEKRSGRVPRLNAIQLAEIKEALQKDPERSGVSANIWDGKSLSWHIENKYGIMLKVRRCQTLFHELGFSLKRARPIVAKGDVVKKEAFKKTSRESAK